MKLSDPVTTLPKVGPAVTKKLERLEIFTLQDLIFHIPFRYEDSSSALNISDLINHANEVVTIRGTVLNIQLFVTRYGKKLVQAKIVDNTGIIDLVWFNQTYVTTYLKKDTEAIFYGKVTLKGKKLSMGSPKYEVVEGEKTKFLGNISGIYPETSGLTSRWIKGKISAIIEFLTYNPYATTDLLIEDPLPDSIKEKYGLVDLITALKFVHTPKNLEEVEKGRERLAFDEILAIQKTVLDAKKLRTALKSLEVKKDINLLNTFIENSPFKPTEAQLRSANEIITDMSKNSPMNRLLEGDVGSGKTWVAAVASLQALKCGHNVVFLAPTSVLATQHSESLIKMIQPFGINVELVTSGTKNARKNLSENKENSDNDQGTLYIGTHALLYDEKILKNLSLVIVDEQHRFGVKQREYLLELESENVKTGIKTTPHFLSMTATPIPRSMALTVFGDLDLSVLDELPKGRVKIDTFLVNEEKRHGCYDWCKQQLKFGDNPPDGLFQTNGVNNQMFVLCPLIKESENMEAKSALAEFEKVKNEFKDFKVELLHGRMKEKEKADILDRFGKKEFDILVATPVIEVGIDIKDATIILIESSERFGLAQLHQLRGRVGRSNKKSYCALFSTDGFFPDRLKFFAQTDLGIKLAEFDLASRGPGEVYGTKQSGIPKLKVANIMDVDLVKKVRDTLTDM
ncbi:MAG: ATP-dependent DNA helicase RecG [bacterium]